MNETTLIDDIGDANEMIGAGWESPVEIHPQTTVIRRRGFEMVEEVVPAFVKISTAFKLELAGIDGNALKVWLFLALSINRNTEQAHPGIRTIAEACRIAQNTVTRAVIDLEASGLLSVNREDRKYNIYEMPAYVSANLKTAPETASKTEADNSKSAKTASTKRQTASKLLRLNQINQIKDSLSAMSVPDAMKVPELKLYHQATGFFPGSAVWSFVAETILTNGLTKAKIEYAYSAWMRRGYRRENIEGILDWAVNGVPENGHKARRNGNGRKPKSSAPPPPTETPEEFQARLEAAKELVR